MRIKKALAIAGLVLLVVVAPLFLYTYFREDATLIADAEKAMRLDTRSAQFSGGPCTHSLQGVEVADRVLGVGHSFNLKINLNNDSAETCDARLIVEAATFDDQQKTKVVSLPPGPLTLYWNLAPKETGPQTINVDSALEQRTIGVFVRDHNYLPPHLVSASAGISAILGPILTIPWWIEFFQKRKARQNDRPGNTTVLLP
jgi:hypothetical protein